MEIEPAELLFRCHVKTGMGLAPVMLFGVLHVLFADNNLARRFCVCWRVLLLPLLLMATTIQSIDEPQ